MSQTITCGFVYVTPRTSEQERLQNGFMIRARTVKRNRQEQLLRKGNEQERHTIRKSNVSARKLLPAKDDVDIVLDGVLGTKLDGHELDTNQHKGEVGSDDEQTQGVSYTAHTTNELGNASLTLTTPISPFFGALATSTFGSSSYSTVSEISILVFNVLFSRVFTRTEIAAYWQSFCETPLIFYSYAHLRLFVHDNVHSGIDGSDKVTKYALNIRISGMLQDALPTSKDADVEPVLLAMILMAKHREDADVKALSGQRTLFTSYNLYADLLEAFRAGHIESFVPAVRALVSRVGA